MSKEITKMEKIKLSNADKIGLAIIICVVSLGLMIIAQIPTPEYLNPVGCLFGTSFIVSGMYAAMGALFMWG